jgi:hypothetical protein
LLVCPFVHAEFALHKKFLAFLNELAEILGGFVPNLQIDESRDLLFLPLRVGVILVVCERGRENSFSVRVYRSSGSAVTLPEMRILFKFITVT